MTPADFIAKAIIAARQSGHIWPEYAVCEAALESRWGESKLAIQCNDLFGQKAGPWTAQQYPVAQISTHEWVDGQMVPCMAEWPIFPDWETSFRERILLLQNAKNQDGSLKYLQALAATSGEEFVVKVSRVWATDPARAHKVLSIYRMHFPSPSTAVQAAMPVDPGITAE